MQTELNRRQSNTARILELLKAQGYATNTQLQAIGGYRYGARLLELRKERHVIVTHRVKDGVYHYTYKGQREPGQLLRPERSKKIQQTSTGQLSLI